MNPELLKALQNVESAVEAAATRQRELADRVHQLEQRGGSPMAAAEARGGHSLVGDVMRSSKLQAFRDGAPTTGRIELKADLVAARKALISIQGAEVTTGQYDVAPTRLPGLANVAQRQLSLLEVLPRLQVGGNTVEFVRLGASFTHAAALQEYESDAKAEQGVPTALASSKIATIAAYVQASKQLMDDEPLLQRQIGDLIGYGVLQKLEVELVAGSGDISGLVTAGTAITATGEPADRISDAASQLITLGWNPGLVVLNPADWHTIRTERSATEGLYIAGSWNVPATPSIWGLPVVTSSSLAVDTALVLDPAQVAILDRQSVTVEISREHGTNFTSNMVTILAELRAGLAIFATGAVGKVDLGLVA